MFEKCAAILVLLLLCSSVSTTNAFQHQRIAALAQLPRHRVTTLRPTAATVEIEPEAQLKPQQQQQQLPEQPLKLSDIRASMPPSVFEKSLPRSLYHMFFDYAMWGGSFIAFAALVKSSLWATLPLLLKAAATVLYSNVAGFFMWCIFVVGHDCGHTTFSKYNWVNNVIGHITHGSILVPFFPWQLSHRRHHMHHNHEEKDYSYIWYTPERLSRERNPLTETFAMNKFFTAVFPFFGWPLYLLGVDDGSHFLPQQQQRLWQSAPAVEARKCLLSTAVVAAFAAAYYALAGGSLQQLAMFLLGPYVMFGWWLVTVTYLQHHGPDTVVYTDEHWRFAEAAFETVDRRFGFGIDALHHHISDGHVVHHLFFTQIPHYHLPAATTALKTFLQQQGLAHLYRKEMTMDFPRRVHSYLWNTGFRAVRYKSNSSSSSSSVDSDNSSVDPSSAAAAAADV